MMTTPIDPGVPGTPVPTPDPVVPTVAPPPPETLETVIAGMSDDINTTNALSKILEGLQNEQAQLTERINNIQSKLDSAQIQLNDKAVKLRKKLDEKFPPGNPPAQLKVKGGGSP